jgi:hypothetical protein
MADKVTARDNGQKFEPHIEGQFAGVCADVVDLGQRVETFPGSQPAIKDKVALVFLTDTEGTTKDVSVEFSVSMNSKASLRKFLEQWRGKAYTDDQARAGVPLDKLVGQPCLLSIEHKKSGTGRTYAKVVSISPLPRALPAPALVGYGRAEFWAERTAQYKQERDAWAAAQVAKQPVGKANTADFSDYPPPPEDETDDLPF